MNDDADVDMKLRCLQCDDEHNGDDGHGDVDAGDGGGDSSAEDDSDGAVMVKTW